MVGTIVQCRLGTGYEKAQQEEVEKKEGIGSDCHQKHQNRNILDRGQW